MADTDTGDVSYNAGLQIAQVGDTKNFVARSAEQAQWGEMLRGLIGPKRGLLSTIVLGNAAPKQSKVTTPSKSRLILIGGKAGVGKTRLGLRLREIAQKDKEFAHRFRTTRLDWAEVRERDGRLAAISPGAALPIPTEFFVEALANHLEREDFSMYLDEYQKAIEETATLSRTVMGAELEAVWEYRARGLGRSLKRLTEERPLLFFVDNCDILGASVELFRPVFEESGSGILWVLIGSLETASTNLRALIAPERFLEMSLESFSPDEMRRLLEVELNRYKTRPGEEGSDSPTLPIYKSPDQVLRFTNLSAGLPLTARLLTYMLESDTQLEEFEAAAPTSDKIKLWLDKLLDEVLVPGHPEYLKIYALAMLRRPERGLLSALLDLRQDMVSIEGLLRLVNARFEFLFEPGRQMVLHSAVAQPLRLWLLQPQHRHQENGVGRLNKRALNYLDERLDGWGLTFNSLKTRLGDVKWSEWVLDKIWHSFWQNEESGWAEALPIFVAALEYKPLVASQLVVLLEELQQLGVIEEPGLSHLHQLQTVANPVNSVPAERREALQNLWNWCQSQHWFGQHFASVDELERILENQLATNQQEV